MKMSNRTHDHPTINKRVKGATHGAQTPKRIIIHSTESLNRPGMVDVLAIPAFWQRQGKGYNAHLIIDGEGLTVKGAYDKQVCWAVAGGNTGSLHIELIGSASFTALQWKKCDVGLKQAAKWCAYWCETHNIPILLSTSRGICTHGMMSAAYGISDHTDPGKNFPLKEFIRRVRYYHKEGWLAAPNP